MSVNVELLNRKIEDSKKIIRQAFDRFDVKEIGVTWTGGKDSTMGLWLMRQVCSEDKRPMPVVFSIDEYDSFDEIKTFLEKYSLDWDIDLRICVNEDVVKAANGQLNSIVLVKDLNQRNRQEIERIGYEDDDFEFEAESFVGNHLMKTVPFNIFIEENNLKAVFQGLRWDEHPSRADDDYFIDREAGDLSPAHTRINPILHFTERDIWDANFHFDIPFNDLYQFGYRSLGAKSSSKKFADIPAWEQDLENTSERGGRRQDKEAAMEKLRELGYM
jgi:phosphoadenosine phosphosulfate reductase